MPHFQIKNRWTDAVLFEGNFNTMLLCAQAAVTSGADLRGADLRVANLVGADLRGAYLGGANLWGANLWGAVKIRALRKTCSRTDGHEFHLWDCEDGTWRVTAGCRFFTLDEAWSHWTQTRDNTPLGEETFDILVMFEHQAERDDAERKEAA